jgi:hypothetical protein
MPYPNQHSCRLHDPGLYDDESFGSIKRGKLVVITARRKGKKGAEAQAYHYPIADWTEDAARKH